MLLALCENLTTPVESCIFIFVAFTKGIVELPRGPVVYGDVATLNLDISVQFGANESLSSLEQLHPFSLGPVRSLKLVLPAGLDPEFPDSHKQLVRASQAGDSAK